MTVRGTIMKCFGVGRVVERVIEDSQDYIDTIYELAMHKIHEVEARKGIAPKYMILSERAYEALMLKQYQIFDEIMSPIGFQGLELVCDPNTDTDIRVLLDPESEFLWGESV